MQKAEAIRRMTYASFKLTYGEKFSSVKTVHVPKAEDVKLIGGYWTNLKTGEVIKN